MKSCPGPVTCKAGLSSLHPSPLTEVSWPAAQERTDGSALPAGCVPLEPGAALRVACAGQAGKLLLL